MNPLLNACAAASRCSSSDGTTTPAAATDNNVYSGAGVALPKGTAVGAQGAFLRAQLPAAAAVQRASIKAFGKEPIDVLLFKVGCDLTPRSRGFGGAARCKAHVH
jgi:hypothetical protein